MYQVVRCRCNAVLCEVFADGSGSVRVKCRSCGRRITVDWERERVNLFSDDRAPKVLAASA